MLFHAALTLALIGSLALAFVLWRWADRVAGARLLTLFLLGVSVWIIGNELPTWFGPAAAPAGLRLLATAALTSAVFLHFTVAFTGTRAPRGVIAGYLAGTAAMLLSMRLPAGDYAPFAGMDYVAMPNRVGWVTSWVWAVLAAAGQVILLRALLTRRGLARRQIGTVIASSAWGLLCMSGYGIAALRLPLAPWPLLGLPLYPVFLVYGILRYELLLANAWARRALAWTLLIALAGLAVAAVPILPIGDAIGARYAAVIAASVAVLLLGGPARRLAERIIYPGGQVTPDDLAAWRADLTAATDTADLAARAARLLTDRLATPVRVLIGPGHTDDTRPVLQCDRQQTGWTSSLTSGWQAAPPGPRRVAAMLGAILADAADRIEQATALAARETERERERQTQARLAELGALAATVAHDVRNPLNIIGMAVATAAPDIRSEVSSQVRRIARLADDLLDYAKPWSIAAAPLDLVALLREAAARNPCVTLDMPDTIPIAADAARLQQAVENLLQNATAAGRHVLIAAEPAPAQIRIHICDDGPGIPTDLRERLFEPFISRSPGGTGLGLAIVARIAAAHGGTVALTDRPGWSTCLTLSLPT